MFEKLQKIIIDYVWPIRRSESSKFLFITLLMFCILGIQNLIRAVKDSIINTLIGTETISFLKFCCVLPSAFLITIIYVKLVNSIKSENIFYIIISAFLSFFFIFAFCLFPYHEILHLNLDLTHKLINQYPHFKWFILLCANWSFSLFYVIAELWSSAVFALLFWQFVNKITSVDESKRFYPIFGLIGQTGLYFSGVFLINLPIMNKYCADLFGLAHNTSVLSVQIVVSVIMILGAISIISFWLINNKILNPATKKNLQFTANKDTMNLKDSLQIVMQSRYIRLIAILLICYGMAINLVEGPWKASAAQKYSTPTEFAAFVGTYLSYTGIFTIIFVLIGSNIVRRLGWLVAAIITPSIVFITGIMFFVTSNFDFITASIMLSFMLTDPVMLAISIGAIQNVLSKSSKYTLFDATKEMSYVPLQDELKTKGKAAVDMIGTKLGKSTSALLQSIIFIILPTATYSSISCFLMLIFAIICMIWIWAVIELNKEYKSACINAAKDNK